MHQISQPKLAHVLPTDEQCGDVPGEDSPPLNDAD
jgi:hypothetical protein